MRMRETRGREIRSLLREDRRPRKGEDLHVDVELLALSRGEGSLVEVHGVIDHIRKNEVSLYFS